MKFLPIVLFSLSILSNCTEGSRYVKPDLFSDYTIGKRVVRVHQYPAKSDHETELLVSNQSLLDGSIVEFLSDPIEIKRSHSEAISMYAKKICKNRGHRIVASHYEEFNGYFQIACN